jgi:hypothetical protein
MVSLLRHNPTRPCVTTRNPCVLGCEARQAARERLRLGSGGSIDVCCEDLARDRKGPQKSPLAKEQNSLLSASGQRMSITCSQWRWWLGARASNLTTSAFLSGRTFSSMILAPMATRKPPCSRMRTAAEPRPRWSGEGWSGCGVLAVRISRSVAPLPPLRGPWLCVYPPRGGIAFIAALLLVRSPKRIL